MAKRKKAIRKSPNKSVDNPPDAELRTGRFGWIVDARTAESLGVIDSWSLWMRVERRPSRRRHWIPGLFDISGAIKGRLLQKLEKGPHPVRLTLVGGSPDSKAVAWFGPAYLELFITRYRFDGDFRAAGPWTIPTTKGR
jgi:hypothetical protein